MKNKLAAVFVFTFSLFSCYSFGQSALDQDEVETYKEEVEKLISFIQYMFNALGSQDLSVQDKDVIVNESYLKAFRDSQVQIEDDLIAGRQVAINKDVQAYLKDIDFFYENVKFDFRIEEIREGINAQGQLFFRVKLNRNLQGTTVEGKTIDNNITRYVEVNLDKENKDLRIASIYTTKIAEKEELINWWTSLPPTWKNILGDNVIAYDNYALSEVSIVNDTSYVIGSMVFHDSDLDISRAIKEAAAVESLDLSNRSDIISIEPVYEMTELKELNISNTSVSSLFPLRNLNSLESLNCSFTTIESLEPLIYCIRLQNLDISNTNIIDLAPIENLRQLETLKADNLVLGSLDVIGNLTALSSLSFENNTALRSLDIIENLGGLTFLNINGSEVSALDPLKSLSQLRTLDISNTPVTSLAALSESDAIENVSMLNTGISSLEPLINTSVKQIFCEGSEISRQEIIDFLKKKPDCEIIFQTKDLRAWWRSIPENWKKIVFNKVVIEGDPTPEMLHQLIKIDTVNISGHSEIDNLAPLEKLLVLRKLNCSNTSITDLSPLAAQTSLEELNFSNTLVSDLSPLRQLDNLTSVNGSRTRVASIAAFENFLELEKLYFDNTNIKNIGVINSLPSFKAGYFDNTQVTDDQVAKLEYDGESAVVVYKTDHLRQWWGNLTDEWQDMFRKELNFDKRPSREEIHKLTGLEKFEVTSIFIDDISVMGEFVRLKELRFNDTQVSDISPLAKMTKLEVLDCSRNPISSLKPLANLTSLRILYADNTQIEDIDALKKLVLLEELKFSGTEVKDLRPLENLVKLRVLEFSNTRVKNIKPIMDLTQLRELKCYNNKLNSKRIDEFREQHPHCQVVFY